MEIVETRYFQIWVNFGGMADLHINCSVMYNFVRMLTCQLFACWVIVCYFVVVC